LAKHSKLEVYCTINNCQWWTEGNVCHASKILVTHDSIGDKYPEEVDSPDLQMIISEVGQSPAEDCMSTCCKTFVSKY
jgi:hypothetical protein